jgi:hypothetical protein
MAHVLVVGGTGMLRGVVHDLATRGDTVSVVARRPDRFAALARAAAGLPGRVNPLPVDYRDGDALRAHLEESGGQFGPFALAVCWIHSTAPDAPFVVADVVNRGPAACRYVHVLASETADPSRSDPGTEARFRRFGSIAYRAVVLGFVLEPGGSRWLTDEEICAGVMRAIARDEVTTVVGTVRPWSERP